MAVNGGRTLDEIGNYQHPLYQVVSRTPGLSLGLAAIDDLLAWGLTNSLWVFPMATSCCGIELMTAAASRVDLDRMGTIVRGTPRQADVMVVAGTITVKMAPRVKKLWDQMPEPRWCIAMGSCAISGDFYRNLYSVVPGVDTFLPVDVYVPGCPPNPEALMHGLLRLQEKVARARRGEKPVPDPRPELLSLTRPSVPRLLDPDRAPEQSALQIDASDEATAAQMPSGLTPLGRLPRTSEPAPAPLGAAPAAADLAGLLVEFGCEASREGPPLLPAARHLEFAQRLLALGYRQYVTVVASHWPAGLERKGKSVGAPEHFEVTTVLRTIGKGSQTASWTVRLLPGEPLPSLSSLFAGADWQEREQFDLVGVTFSGHPDPRRLMMAENFTGHPLRRDFPSDAAAPPVEVTVRATTVERRVDPHLQIDQYDPEGELMLLHFGPQHPSTHGVFRMDLLLDGELIVKAIPHVGYLHRAVEKLCERLTYVQLTPVVDKNDYVAPMTNEQALVMAFEKLLKLEVPRRARWLRTLFAELQRISSHLLALGTFALDLGGALGGGSTLFLHTFRERELILDLFEEVTGARFHYNTHCIGGNRHDLPAGWAARAKAALDVIESRLPEYSALTIDHRIFQLRTQGVGVLDGDLALALGITGPNLRASGIDHDLRRDAPFHAYDELEVRVVTEEAGDCFARAVVRVREVAESIRLSRNLIDGMPEGPILAGRPLRLPGQTKIPAGQVYAALETPRGELGTWLVADGTQLPYRLKIRPPSLHALSALPYLLPGARVSDAVAILGSLDPIMGEVDR